MLSNDWDTIHSTPKRKKYFKLGLLNLAQELHMYKTGSSDYLTHQDVKDIASYLRARLMYWDARSATEPGAIFDEAVKLVVLTALDENKELV